jgi:hypothetical protein
MDLPHGHLTTMSLFNQMLAQKSTRVGAPCVEVKKSFSAFIRKFALNFKHLLCGKILYINISIFCIATSFVAIVILAVIMGDKSKIVVI